MNIRILCPGLIALCLVFGSLNNASAQSEVLRWNLKPGQAFDLEMKQNMTQEINIAGQTQTIPVNFTMNMSMEVVEGDGETFKVNETINRVRMSMESPFFSLDYDSDSEEEPEGMAADIAGGFSALIGLEIGRTLNARGETIECEVNEEALEAIADSQVGSQFASKESLKNLFRQGGCILPEGEVNAGTSWEDSFDVPSAGMTVKTTAKYEYAGEEEVDGRTLSKINVETSVEMVPDDNAPVEVQVTEQKNAGVIYFDNEAGVLSHSTMDQDMSMLVVQGGMEMDIKMTGTADFKVTKKE